MPSAVIADDEPLLAEDLRRRLAALWPELDVAAVLGDGVAALAAINRLRPDFAFLDIRMPGLSGVQVAQGVAGTRVVFVTAYDAFALQAFDAAAADYLLKPLDEARLLKCIARLQQTHGAPPPAPPALATPRLHWITAGLGDSKRLIAAGEVVYFKARDKYTEVVTVEESHLIRMSLRELAARLDPDGFAQIHRGLIVNLAQVLSIEQDLLGRCSLRLKSRPETLPLSRGYAQRFKAM